MGGTDDKDDHKDKRNGAAQMTMPFVPGADTLDIGRKARDRHSPPASPTKRSERANIDEGIRQRDDAIARVDAHASDAWKREAMAATRAVAEQMAEFTTDPVWAVLEERKVPAPHEPRAMGAIMKGAVDDGLCKRTERHKNSVRPGCHRRPMRVYESLIYKRTPT